MTELLHKWIEHKLLWTVVIMLSEAGLWMLGTPVYHFSGIALRCMPRTSLIRSQHWFRLWLVAVRQKVITWVNVEPDLCHHVASLSHSESILSAWDTLLESESSIANITGALCRTVKMVFKILLVPQGPAKISQIDDDEWQTVQFVRWAGMLVHINVLFQQLNERLLVIVWAVGPNGDFVGWDDPISNNNNTE